MSLPHFHFYGTTYEQGLQHGEALKKSILNNIEIYLNRFEAEAGICKKELLDKANIYFPILRKQGPEYVNALMGISESSNVDIIEIVMLNLRYELLYHALGKRYQEEAIDGCTAFAILPEISQNNHLIMGQNWDWIPDIECVLTSTRDVDGLKRVSFTEAGIFAGKPGMNSEGVGLAVNGMYSTSDDWARLQKPFHLRCYEALRSKNMDGSLKALIDTPRSCTANFIVGHAPNEVVNIELAPDKLRLIDPKDGILSHANHFIDPEALGIYEPPNPRRHFSEFREKRMGNLLKEQKSINIPDIKNILKDHENHPQSLCRHRDDALPKSQHTITKTAMIMDLEELKMWVTYGQPCKKEFEAFELS
jgi:isopenicillin-N N-acyltransferase-like protein